MCMGLAQARPNYYIYPPAHDFVVESLCLPICLVLTKNDYHSHSTHYITSAILNAEPGCNVATVVIQIMLNDL